MLALTLGQHIWVTNLDHIPCTPSSGDPDFCSPDIVDLL